MILVVEVRGRGDVGWLGRRRQLMGWGECLRRRRRCQRGKIPVEGHRRRCWEGSL